MTGTVTPEGLAAHLRAQGYDMTEDDARESLESHVAAGFMVRNADGTYSPTSLGRIVGESSGGPN